MEEPGARREFNSRELAVAGRNKTTYIADREGRVFAEVLWVAEVSLWRSRDGEFEF